jgi:hypothetical protein
LRIAQRATSDILLPKSRYLGEALMAQDASHPDKRRTLGAALNPAKHDNAVPAAGVLDVALADLRYLKKTYL